jgi:hypothetical protein
MSKLKLEIGIPVLGFVGLEELRQCLEVPDSHCFHFCLRWRGAGTRTFRWPGADGLSHDNSEGTPLGQWQHTEQAHREEWHREAHGSVRPSLHPKKLDH